jgi:hypothetical protein
MTRSLTAGALIALLAVSATVGVQAQGTTKSPGGASQRFGMGYTDIGFVLGFGGINDASLSFGGRFEKAVKPLPDLADGTLAIGVSFDYWHYEWQGYEFSHMPIGVTANYHVRIENGKWDPFFGLGLGYLIVDTPFPGDYEGSGLYFIARLGLRYFLKSRMALYGDVGTGASTLNLGLTFQL